MKVLLFGKNGQVGAELAASLTRHGNELTALDRAQADLMKPDQIVSAISVAKPDVVINGAAYTAVDRAESEPAIAKSINANAVEVMAEECRKIGALLVHYSTDYVFNGEKRSPYLEEDETAPLNVYGQTKLEGEKAIIASGGRHLVLRIGWVYSPRGSNFLLTVRRLAQERKVLTIVDDQIGVPTSAKAIADISCRVIQRPNPPEGVYHFSPAGQTSWFGFAQEIVRRLDLPVDLRAIPTSAYPTAAQRPQYSVLSGKKLQCRLDFQPPSWQELLANTVVDLHQ